MSAQKFISKLTGVVMIFCASLFYLQGTMELTISIVMCVAAFIVYASLDSAGNYSALLRIVDISVDRAQEILDVPQMDLTGEEIHPEDLNLEALNIDFS